MSLLSQTTEYALQAMVLLAANEDEPRTSRQITVATNAPEGYLSKVMHTLVRAGLVNSRRGPGGGFTLARRADSITLLDIVDAVDPLVLIERCPLGRNTDDCRELCALHRRINHSTQLVRKALQETRISELLAHPPHWLEEGHSAAEDPSSPRAEEA